MFSKRIAAVGVKPRPGAICQVNSTQNYTKNIFRAPLAWKRAQQCVVSEKMDSALADLRRRMELSQSESEYKELESQFRCLKQQFLNSRRVVYEFPSGENWDFICGLLRQVVPDFPTLEGLLLASYEKFHMPTENHQLVGLRKAVADLEQVDAEFKFFEKIVPKIQEWALECHTCFPEKSLPVLQARRAGAVNLSRQQVRCINALAFFSMLPHLEVPHAQRYGYYDWRKLYARSSYVGVERVKCQLYYFYRSLGLAKPELEQMVSFHRVVATGADFFPNWKESSAIPLPVTVTHEKVIEDSPAAVHVDFANCDLHIAQIIPSATQEEVIFSIRPELFPGLLFCETMQDDEAIIMCGARQYCEYSGYLDTFTFRGGSDKYSNPTPAAILAIDAIVNYGTTQFQPKYLERDLNKAFIGFVGLDGIIPEPEFDPTNPKHCIATGNWGCGAFGGDHVLKFVQQVMAAAVARRALHYSTFGNPPLCDKLQEVNEALQGRSVADLWKIISRHISSPKKSFYNFLMVELLRLARPVEPALTAPKEPRESV
eukprot:TRINITY_DN2817_c0_g1_i1.p1 TRINITY_DN2817_c0_g1~~TRINITY_DN2817_c0_g1_i1.p1  ORF type:complete len:543 (+),score=74.01 TRINITY_DN2817_c0_g1_i1:813-2441(+)